MTARVLYFGELKEFMKMSEDTIPVVENEIMRVCDVLPALLKVHDRQHAWHGRLLYAVNHEQVAQDHRISVGDEIALMPPMTGG